MSDDTSNGGDGETPPFDADGPGDAGRSIDVLFETVSDRRARYVLTHLESISVDVVDLDDIAEHVAARERAADAGCDSGPGGDPDAGAEGDAAAGDDGAARRDEPETDPERHRQRVALALHHNHLPRLDAAAVLDYDPRSRTVRYRGDDRVSTVLELLRAPEER